MGGEKEGDSLFAVQAVHEMDDLLAGFGVQVGGGFIGQD